MLEDTQNTMGRYRAIMTETDRKHISGDSNPSQDQKDQAVYRVRQRITEELPRDIGVLENNRPDLLDELRKEVCPTPRLAKGINAYVAIKDHPRTGENEIEFDGHPIPRIDYTGQTQETIGWGYGGRGPTSAARSILEHAVRELELEDVEVETDDAIEFRQSFLEHEDGDYWAIPLSEIQLWIEQNVE